MNTVKKIDETSTRLDVKVSATEYKDIVTKVYEDIASQVKVPGFRKGKVPRQIINQRVGTAYVIEEVTNQVISKYYQNAALENDLKVMGQPEVEVISAYSPLDESKDIEFTATVDVRPEIKLPELKGRSVKVTVEKPAKDELEARIESLRQNASTKNEDGSIETPDDEDLAAILGVEDFADLKEKVSADLEAAALSRSVGDAGDKVLEDLLKDTDIPLPQKVVDQQVEHFLQNDPSRQNATKKDAEPTAEERKTATKRAESDIRAQVLLDTYADENDIKVGQNEIFTYLQNTAYQYGIEPNQFIQMMASQGQIPLAAAEVSRSKTLAHMLRRVKVIDEKGKELDISRFIGEDEPAETKAETKAGTKNAGSKSSSSKSSPEEKADEKAGAKAPAKSAKVVTKTTSTKKATADKGSAKSPVKKTAKKEVKEKVDE
ncbi:MAG: hypothetical protein LBC50_00750 [Candidatus Ancillula sp.]|jgi:trigger factor|nr:hypothetical protein [Candidatus Ancillula sp.]